MGNMFVDRDAGGDSRTCVIMVLWYMNSTSMHTVNNPVVGVGIV
jgi:hypothetical protein